MRNKLFTYIFLFSLLVAVFSTVSYNFDNDFGWHLRFGYDAFNGNFQFNDSYTYTYFNKPWINHEWGGDLVFWLIYNNFTYLGIVLISALAIFISLIIATKIYGDKISSSSLIVAWIILEATREGIQPRLNMLAPLFFTICWWGLEKINQNKNRYIYFCPLFFWLWAALHGSWIIGFILINIYLGANILGHFLPKNFLKIINNPWPVKTIIKVIIAEIASALIILINPYGLNLWKEVLSYFTHNFYKLHISEWVPSYAYPILTLAIFLNVLAVYFFINNWKKQKLNLTQIFIFIFFLISAILYRRNQIYILLISLPWISLGLSQLFNWLKIKLTPLLPENKLTKNLLILFLLISFLAINLIYFSSARLTTNPWINKKFFEDSHKPFETVQFINKNLADKKMFIFNEFSWGGYLNWNLPQALIFADGRGTATWMWNKEISLLEHYLKLVNEPDGLTEINNSSANYILLKQTAYQPQPDPSPIDKIVFSKKLEKIYNPKERQLEQDLKLDNKWQLIYSDNMANLWEKITTP